jgi:Ca-activated chloride channel family protein
MLAVAPRFDEETWTMAFVALNTAVDVRDAPKRPRHLIVVREPWEQPYSNFGNLTDALLVLADSLAPTDIVSVIDAGPEPRRLAEALPSHELGRVTATPRPAHATLRVDPYGGLTAALELATSTRYADFAHHVVLLTSGLSGATYASPTVGSLAEFEALATRFAMADCPVSVVGLANDRYERSVPSAVAEITGGNYHFATDTDDLHDALSVEAETAFVPLARDLRIEVTAAPGYRVGQVFGARRATISDARATIESPVLYAGAREDSFDVGAGRRGGGGGFFVQLLSDTEGDAKPAPAFALTVRYDAAETGEPHEFEFTVSTPLGVGRRPPPTEAFFSDSARAKPFMVLNMYLALRAALRLYEGQGCGGALGIRDMMEQSYQYWSRTYSDPDIDGDFDLLQQLTYNIAERCDQSRYQVPNVELGCFLT